MPHSVFASLFCILQSAFTPLSYSIPTAGLSGGKSNSFTPILESRKLGPREVQAPHLRSNIGSPYSFHTPGWPIPGHASTLPCPGQTSQVNHRTPPSTLRVTSESFSTQPSQQLRPTVQNGHPDKTGLLFLRYILPASHHPANTDRARSFWEVPLV